METTPLFYVRRGSAVTSLGNEGLCLRSLGSPLSLTLKGPPAVVWSLADGSHSIHCMTLRIARQFRMSYLAAKSAVESCLANLRKAGLILPDLNDLRDAAQIPIGAEKGNGPDESRERSEKKVMRG